MEELAIRTHLPTEPAPKSSPREDHEEPELEEFVAACMHGNCVFPNDDGIAEVQHKSGKSVVSGSEGAKGKVHFPLGLMWGAGSVKVDESKLVRGAWLRVDCGPVHLNSGGTLTEIVTAEVFVGCVCVWSKDFSTAADAKKTSTFKELMSPIKIDLNLEEEGPRGLEITLTLKFGSVPIRFCSTAIYGIRPKVRRSCVPGDDDNDPVQV